MRRPALLPLRPLPERGGRGFALAAVLLTISLLLIVLVVFSGVVSVETTSSGNAELNARARQNAITAMNLALGELQKEMGPDQRVSATAELMAGALANPALTNNAAWTGVWRSTNWDGSSVPDYTAGKANVFREWLVSMPTNQPSTSAILPATALPVATNTVALVGAGTCGISNKVVVYKIAGELTNSVQSSYAWWIGDEGVKARINRPFLPRGTPATADAAQIAALLTAPGANPTAVPNFAGIATTGVTNQDLVLQKAVTYGNLSVAYKATSLASNFFDFTPYSQGVLADVQHGGLKHDLSLLLEQAPAFAINATTAGATATDFPQASPLVSAAFTDPVYTLNGQVAAVSLNNNAASPSVSGYPWLYAYSTATYLGTDWGYLYRYYNVYKKVFRSPTDGAYTLNFDNYNGGLGNLAVNDSLYSPGSNPSTPPTDQSGPYSNNTVTGLGGLIYQWKDGQYPGRADFVLPILLRLQLVFGLYRGSLDYPNVGKGTPGSTWASAYSSYPTVNPTSTTPLVYYMAYFPVIHLWNPYNIRIKTGPKGKVTGLGWHTPCPPVQLTMDPANTGATGTDGWANLSYPGSAAQGGNSIFWPSGGQIGDLLTGYGSNGSYGSMPITLEPGAVAVYGPLAKSQAGAINSAGGIFTGDGKLSAAGAATPPSTQNPYGAPASGMSNSGQRTYVLATTSPGWPTSPLSPMISHALGTAMQTASGCYVAGSTAPTSYTYKDYISANAFTSLTLRLRFDFSKINAPNTPSNLGGFMLGGGYSKSSPTSTSVLASNYEINLGGSAATPDATAYPSLPASSGAALTILASNVPTFPDSADFANAGTTIQPLPLFMLSLNRRVYSDVQGGTRFGLFTDPLARVHQVATSTLQEALTSPYEYSLKYLQSNPFGGMSINDPTPGAADNGADPTYNGYAGQSSFDPATPPKVLYNVVAELPVAPLLSLAQIQNAPLGRDFGNPANAVCDANNGSRATDNYAGAIPAASVKAYAATFNHAFANSYAHPLIPANALNNTSGGDGRSFDQSFYANNALWDRYFFSGIAPQDSAAFSPYNGSTANPRTAYNVLADFVSGTATLPDPRYSLYVPAGHASAEIQKELLPNATSAGFSSVNAEGVCGGDVYSGTTTQAVSGTTVTPYSQTSTYLMNQGAFNVNSVSVAAWTALLSGVRSPGLSSLNLPYTLTASSTSSSVGTTGSMLFPFLRFMLPNNTGLQTSGSAVQNFWNGFQELSTAQIQLLAKNIVVEVKRRGPFLTLAEFVNRQVSGDTTVNAAGALQTAIDGPTATSMDATLVDPQINTLTGGTVSGAAFPNSAAGTGPKLSGTPACLTQADLLTPLANVIAVRSDTFIIRSYGEVAVAGKIQARAWCEAVVQRVPDYVINKVSAADAGDLPSANPPLNALNLKFGRKFKVVQFRWLSPSEI